MRSNNIGIPEFAGQRRQASLLIHLSPNKAHTFIRKPEFTGKTRSFALHRSDEMARMRPVSHREKEAPLALASYAKLIYFL